MRLNSIKILKISITADPKQKILEEIRKYLAKTAKFKREGAKLKIKPLVIVTPNPEQIVLAQKNKRFADILNRADVALPDGIGVVWASQLLGNLELGTHNFEPLRQIPGVEFMEDLVKMAAEEGFPIGLIGSRHNLAVQAFDCLRKKYLGLTGWAQDGPELEIKSDQSDQFTNPTNQLKQSNNLTIKQSEDDDLGQYLKSVVEKIRGSGTRLVFVGLGAPKQEYFIEKLSAVSCQLSAPLVLMSVGGSFDIIAGKIHRAPVVLRLLGFEWLWRLLREPWRFRRQLALLKFAWLVLKTRFGRQD